jgi:hypothetical protein
MYRVAAKNSWITSDEYVKSGCEEQLDQQVLICTE